MLSIRTELHKSAFWSIWFCVMKNNILIVFQCLLLNCEEGWSPIWLPKHDLIKGNANDIVTWKSESSGGLIPRQRNIGTKECQE